MSVKLYLMVGDEQMDDLKNPYLSAGYMHVDFFGIRNNPEQDPKKERMMITLL
jgi:hypothetical protein